MCALRRRSGAHFSRRSRNVQALLSLRLTRGVPLPTHAGFVVNARFMAEVQSQQQQQRLRIEALQFENERLR